jgi:hypothetical protein
MQPPTSTGQGTPERPLPIAQVTIGMTVVDIAGEEVGTVTAVEMPGTDVQPDLPDLPDQQLMTAGYVRVDGTGPLGAGYYVDGEQVAGVTTTEDAGTVNLTVTKDDLRTT